MGIDKKPSWLASAVILLMVVFFVVRLHPVRYSAQQPQTQTAPIYAVNAKYVNGVAPGYAPTSGGGLTLVISAGSVVCNTTPVTYAGGALTLTASSTNYVQLDASSSCPPLSNTTGFISGNSPIAVVITGSSSITTIEDFRPMGTNPGSSSSSGVIEIGSGTQALPTVELSPGDCADTISIAISGITATDSTVLDYTETPLGKAGYDGSIGEMLTISRWPSTGFINISQCNSIENPNPIPPAAMTVKYLVER